MPNEITNLPLILPRLVVDRSDEDGVWIAEAPDLKPCAAHGDTPEQAISELRTAMALWLEVAREEGWPLPAPRFRAPAAAAE
jgi:predicted RNase H-like HicB family nuclease